MEPKFNTSFIPKKSLQANVTGGPKGTPGQQYVKRRSTHGPGFFLMLLIFILTIVGAGGIFGYTKITERNIDGLISRLQEAQKAFDPAAVDRLTREGLRIKSAQRLLSSHVTLTELFELLESQTLKEVRYKTLSYSGALGAVPTMQLNGESTSFANVALQVTQYRISPGLNSPVVTGLTRLTDGNASFSTDMQVNPRIILYPTVLEDGLRGNMETITSPTEPETTEEPAAEEEEEEAAEEPVAAAPAEPEEPEEPAIPTPPAPPVVNDSTF
jgi:hypothetical protein